jgi:hypothetical protein
MQGYKDKELIILNNHPDPLYFDHPEVKIINDIKLPTLGHCRQELLKHATGEFIRTWDDDDFYLPWTLEQGFAHIDSLDAWKPSHSWFYRVLDGHMALAQNIFEASITFRKSFVEGIGYRKSLGDEHIPLFEKMPETPQANMGYLTSYIYNWHDGEYHASQNFEGTIEDRVAHWKKLNDEGLHGKLVPFNPVKDWEILIRHIPDNFKPHFRRQLLEKSYG